MSRAQHWDQAYTHGVEARSWYQTQSGPSLRMLDAAKVSTLDSCIDIGGGASTLVDALLARGHTDLSVLDVSATGLQIAQQRLGPDADRVHWLRTDLRSWQPARSYRVWHDRAVLHFLTDQPSRQRYLHALTAATEPGSLAIIATFAPDGPQHCSGLPVRSYSADDLTNLLGEPWQLINADHEQHTTPAAAVQPFTWAAFRRTAPRRGIATAANSAGATRTRR